jgi:hypothetical protein
MEDSDCQLVNDCCSCTAIAVGQEPPPCDLPECFVPTCEPYGIDSVYCRAGQCQIGPKTCDPTLVSCDSLPPDCSPGLAAEVDTSAGCWSGACVPADACDAVGDCADCGPNLACISVQGGAPGPQLHCEAPWQGCGNTATCACMGNICGGGPFECAETPDGLSCTCALCP